MSYSEFRDDMLLALYESARSDPQAEFWSFKEVADIYGIDWKPGWLIELQRELRDEGLIRGPSNGQNDDMAIGRLSGPGMRFIENEHGDLDGVPTLIEKRKASTALQVDDAISESMATEPVLTAHDPPAIDSARWTGVEQRLARDPQRVDEIRAKIREIDSLLSKAGLSNHEMARARAIAEALVKLVESPEPEWKAIVDLLKSPALGGALNLVALIQLVVTFILGTQ